MKIINLIHKPDVIARILRHLGLWKQHPDPREGKTRAPEDWPVVMEDFYDGLPGYEEPVFISPEIGTELALTEATTPATQKPRKSDFLSPYHLTSLSPIVDLHRP